MLEAVARRGREGCRGGGLWGDDECRGVCFLLRVPSFALSCWGRVASSRMGREKGWP